MLLFALTSVVRASLSTFGPELHLAIAQRFVRPMALYSGIVGLAVLMFMYISMTRLVVAPIVALARAARRVSDGKRALEIPSAGALEIAELGHSLVEMTEKLRADGEALRAKVREVEEHAENLKHAQESLVRSERLASVGRLASGLAHEIGNPLAAILGFQELLLQGGISDADANDYLERMKRETERIHRVLRDLLDFARVEVGHEIAEAPGSVSEAVMDVLSLVRPQRAFRNVAIESSVEPSLGSVRLATSRLVQVLLNVLLNAADAIGDRAGHIWIGAERIDGDRVRITIEDDGPGIPVEVREHLFEPFVTSKPHGKGTGLGLAVCRGIVASGGGLMVADDRPGGGAKFTVELCAETSP